MQTELLDGYGATLPWAATLGWNAMSFADTAEYLVEVSNDSEFATNVVASDWATGLDHRAYLASGRAPLL